MVPAVTRGRRVSFADRSSDGDDAVVVEFCGLPGAGKTTSAQLLVRDLRELGVRATFANRPISPQVASPVRLLRKAALAVDEGWRFPSSTVRAILRVAESQKLRPGDALSRSLQWLITQRAVDRSTAVADAVVLDEGMIQALFSIGLRGEIDALLEDLASGAIRWRGPDLVVALEISPRSAAERLATRPSGHSRTERLAGRARLKELERSKLLLSSLLAWWEIIGEEHHLVRLPEPSSFPDEAGIAALVGRIRELVSIRTAS